MSGNHGTPIVLDPAIRRVLNSPGPSLKDFEQMPSRKVVSSESENADTLDELIDVLETMRDTFGGDAEVKSWEGGGHIHVTASEYDDGEVELRL